MTDTTTTAEDAFEALQRFADVWHDKYAQPRVPGGVNRKPPSLTMRAGGVAAVLTEPQLLAVVAEYARMRDELDRFRGLDAAAKELLARNVELGTRADNAEAKCEDLEDEVQQLREQLAEATALLGHFVDHEGQPCRLNHHGACEEHGGSGLRACDVAVGRELLARIRGGE